MTPILAICTTVLSFVVLHRTVRASQTRGIPLLPALRNVHPYGAWAPLPLLVAAFAVATLAGALEPLFAVSVVVLAITGVIRAMSPGREGWTVTRTEVVLGGVRTAIPGDLDAVRLCTNTRSIEIVTLDEEGNPTAIRSLSRQSNYLAAWHLIGLRAAAQQRSVRDVEEVPLTSGSAILWRSVSRGPRFWVLLTLTWVLWTGGGGLVTESLLVGLVGWWGSSWAPLPAIGPDAGFAGMLGMFWMTVAAMVVWVVASLLLPGLVAASALLSEVRPVALRVFGNRLVLCRGKEAIPFTAEDVVGMHPTPRHLTLELRDGRAFSLRAADPVALREAFEAVGAGVSEGAPVEAPVQLQRIRGVAASA